ncbi:protein kinase domain-containing protein [Nonomuraea sp. NPDC004354]
MQELQPLLAHEAARVGDYELLGRLGEGGQGVVYLGRSSSGERVAVKMLHARFSGDVTARDRFLREVAAARKVAEFSTARVLDASTEGDRPFIVSEYVEGVSLDQLVRENGPRPAGALERLAVGTMAALAAIHRADVVHRDFKPSNVLLGLDGARVIDFGIAKALDATTASASGLIGTPAYMSPEQISGEAVGPASDLFAWAVTMVFAATGRLAFGGDTVPAIFHRILTKEPELPELDEPLGSLVRGCLAKDPSARPTAQEALLRLVRHQPDVRPAPAAQAPFPPSAGPATRPEGVLPRTLVETATEMEPAHPGRAAERSAPEPASGTAQPSGAAHPSGTAGPSGTARLGEPVLPADAAHPHEAAQYEAAQHEHAQHAAGHPHQAAHPHEAAPSGGSAHPNEASSNEAASSDPAGRPPRKAEPPRRSTPPGEAPHSEEAPPRGETAPPGHAAPGGSAVPGHAAPAVDAASGPATPPGQPPSPGRAAPADTPARPGQPAPPNGEAGSGHATPSGPGHGTPPHGPAPAAGHGTPPGGPGHGTPSGGPGHGTPPGGSASPGRAGQGAEEGSAPRKAAGTARRKRTGSRRNTPDEATAALQAVGDAATDPGIPPARRAMPAMPGKPGRTRRREDTAPVEPVPTALLPELNAARPTLTRKRRRLRPALLMATGAVLAGLSAVVIMPNLMSSSGNGGGSSVRQQYVDPGPITGQVEDPPVKQTTKAKARATVTLPALEGWHIDDAVAELEDLGLAVRLKSVPDEEAAMDIVISTSPASGRRLAKGSTVTIVVSAGPEGEQAVDPSQSPTTDPGDSGEQEPEPTEESTPEPQNPTPTTAEESPSPEPELTELKGG